MKKMMDDDNALHAPKYQNSKIHEPTCLMRVVFPQNKKWTRDCGDEWPFNTSRWIDINGE